MAIGMAKILGFHFPDNFRRPFLAASITELWRRWHISLSSWLRDYVYIPLGGNRGGTLKTYRNLMLTMLLGGLWHGASWNYVIWGGCHGVFLSVERLLGVGRQDTAVRSWSYPFRALLTFTLFLISQAFFRAADLSQSLSVIRQMFAGHPGRLLLEPWHLLLAAASLAIALAEEHLAWSDRLMRAPALAYALALALILFTVEIFGFVDASIPFIYFQF